MCRFCFPYHINDCPFLSLLSLTFIEMQSIKKNYGLKQTLFYCFVVKFKRLLCSKTKATIQDIWAVYGMPCIDKNRQRN